MSELFEVGFFLAGLGVLVTGIGYLIRVLLMDLGYRDKDNESTTN